MFKGSSLNVSSHSNLCVRTWVATGRGHLPNKVVFCIFILRSPISYVRASVCEVLLRNKIMSRLAGTRPSKRRNSSFLAQMVQKRRKMDFHINQAKRLIKSTDANPNLNADYRKTLVGNIGCRSFHASLRVPRSSDVLLLHRWVDGCEPILNTAGGSFRLKPSGLAFPLYPARRWSLGQGWDASVENLIFDTNVLNHWTHHFN